MSAQVATSQSSFGASAARGTLWTGIRYLAEYTLRFGSNLILTRLLFPEAFGLMTLITTLIVGLGLFSDIGLNTSVVQSSRGDDPRFLRTVWTLQVLRGLVLWTIASALAGPAAAFYGEPQLRLLIPVSALSAAIAGFNSMSLALMQRHLQLGRLAAIELATQVLTTASTLVWALFEPSVWALLGGTLIGYGARVVMSYVVARGAPLGFGWERESIRQLLRFGVWIFFSTALFFLTTQADRLLFGWLLSVKTLGVYGVAMALATIPTQLAWNVGNFVLLPTFSRQVQAGQPLEPSYRRLQLLVLVPAALPVVGLLACGPALVEILYDPRYHDAGWMLQLAAVGTWFQIPQALSANALLAYGQPHWMAIANGTKLLGMMAVVSAGYLLFGAGGAIGGVAISEAVRWASLAYGVQRRGLPGFRADLVCSLLVLAAGGVALLATELMGRAGFGPLARLAAGVAALLAVWLPAAALLLRDDLRTLWLRFGHRVNG